MNTTGKRLILKPLAVAIFSASLLPVAVQAETVDELSQQMREMQAQMQVMQQKMLEMQKNLEKAQAEAAAAKAQASVTPVGGIQELDPGMLKRAQELAGEQEEAEAIEAGRVAAAKPKSERTDEDLTVMSRGSLLEKGILPGYQVFRGTETEYKFGGFVRVDFAHDFNRVDSDWDNDIGSWAFAVLTDDVQGHGESGRTFVNTSATRLNVDIRTQTPGFGQFKEMNVFVEGDFWESENNFRIRHAIGQWGPLLVGKTWPMFAPLGAMPSMFDFGGPVISVPIRENEIRWDQPFGDKFKLGINATEPGLEIDIPELGGVKVAQTDESIPDVTIRGLYEDDWGHFKASTMFRNISVNGRSPGVDDDQKLGYNVFLSGAFKIGDKDKLGWGLSYGDGFSHWRTGIAFQNQDAVLTDSGLNLTPSYGGFLTYEHWWQPKLSSSFIYSYLGADNATEAGLDAIKEENYGLANVIWHVTPVVNFGIEYTYADRTNESNSDGERNRINFVAVWKFHKDTPKSSPYRNLSYLFGGG